MTDPTLHFFSRSKAVAAVLRAAAFTLAVAVGPPLPARAQTCIPDATPDWIASVPMLVSSVQARPADCATVQQTPPDISWPDLSSDARYEVTLTYPDGTARTRTAPQNWINWDEALPAGSYTWQVQVTNSGGTQVSHARRFTVAADAVPFVVPDWTVLFDRAVVKPHPRALPDAATAQVMTDQRRAEFDLLLSEVAGQLDDPIVAEPTSTSKTLVTALTNLESGRALDAALAWLLTNKEEYLADALMRALNLASWDPQGSTSYAIDDEVSRRIAWTLTLVYDWLFPRLDAAQKDALLASILARGLDMYNDVIGSRARIAVHPYNSHGNHTLIHLAAICVLLAGDIPEAWGGLRETLPLALHWTSPWGGEDGGFGNGTNYAHYVNGDALIPWYVLRWAVGVDIGQKAWVRNYARYLAYFLPPGTPTGAFGDGAEQKTTEAWARYGKAHTLFSPTLIGRWYASQLAGEDPTRLELLLAPPADPNPAPYPASTPDAALFPSIGWAAMHGNLPDPARVSVYFKSSFYASYNHSHADQNSFIINAGGERLAIDSGYYDGYQTSHWWQWYKRTRAHNAVTFDGGQGQVVFEEGSQYGPGTVSRFEHQPGYDIVTGDATQAYGGALTQAKRSLVYLRPNHVLVYDLLASGIPRQWEWNIHALNLLTVVSDQRISIANNGQSLCVDMLAGPAMRFTQNDLFTAEPSSGAPQWHGTFSSIDLLGSTEFIALLNVGCTATAASASKTDGVWTVQVDAKTVIIGDSGISVQ